MAQIRLLYDTVSPFSWLAFECLTRYQKIWPDVSLSLEPVFLGGIMNLAENKPPATVALKGSYMMKHDLPNLSKLFNVKTNQPKNFPENSLKAQRILVAIKMREPEKLEEASRQLWIMYWRNQKSFAVDADIIEALSPVLTSAGADTYLTTHAQSPEVKNELSRVTKEAVEELGAFGAPWIIVRRADGKSEVFFGSDRMESIAFFLGKPYLGVNPNISKL